MFQFRRITCELPDNTTESLNSMQCREHKFESLKKTANGSEAGPGYLGGMIA